MEKKKEEALVSKYPKIFADVGKSMQETCMYWGFAHKDGWYWILDQLCDSIQGYIDNNSTKVRIKNSYARRLVKFINSYRYKNDPKWFKPIKKFIYKQVDAFEKYCEKETIETIPQVIAEQVKEKFGTLNFYYRGGNRIIDGMVYLAESMSVSTCETCGSTKDVVMNKSGWITVKCKRCIGRDKKASEEKLNGKTESK
jgi:hypothetical protein